MLQRVEWGISIGNFRCLDPKNPTVELEILEFWFPSCHEIRLDSELNGLNSDQEGQELRSSRDPPWRVAMMKSPMETRRLIWFECFFLLFFEDWKFRLGNSTTLKPMDFTCSFTNANRRHSPVARHCGSRPWDGDGRPDGLCEKLVSWHFQRLRCREGLHVTLKGELGEIETPWLLTDESDFR